MITASRARAILLALGVLVLISWMHLYGRALWTQTPKINVPESPAGGQAAFWQHFRPLLEQHSPNCPPLKREGTAGDIGFNAVHATPRPNLIIKGNSYLPPMQHAHDAFVHAIQNNSEVLKSAHTPGTRGMVYSAGGSYLPLFVTSLLMLRKTGSTLPVEVFIKDQGEYERSICDELLPSLNARCLILSDILGGRGKGKVEIAHYQIKIFAVLFSSFEDIVWIDSDCFPLWDPERLLESEPFSSSGLVTWPDFWALTASPLYYSISRQPIPETTSRASSETGVFLISKKSHFSTLLLAAYYNYYGPSHYFTLLSQGAPGEGDKETFVHAASALGEKFYAVSEPVKPIGHPKPRGGISGSAMVQSDPRADFELTSQGKWRVKDPSVAKPPAVFFIHAHYPKFNPAGHLFGNTWETAPTLGPDGSDARAWTVGPATLRRFGYDAERSYWEEIKWVSCNLEHAFSSWKGTIHICERVKLYWANVFEAPGQGVPQFTDSE